MLYRMSRERSKVWHTGEGKLLSFLAYFLALCPSLSTIFPDVDSPSLWISSSAPSSKLSNLWHQNGSGIKQMERAKSIPCWWRGNSKWEKWEGIQTHLPSHPFMQQHLTQPQGQPTAVLRRAQGTWGLCSVPNESFFHSVFSRLTFYSNFHITKIRGLLLLPHLDTDLASWMNELILALRKMRAVLITAPFLGGQLW